jgi:hypothetical protein
VIADVAYFGISKWGTRADRDDVNKTSEARCCSPSRMHCMHCMHRIVDSSADATHVRRLLRST